MDQDLKNKIQAIVQHHINGRNDAIITEEIVQAMREAETGNPELCAASGVTFESARRQAIHFALRATDIGERFDGTPIGQPTVATHLRDRAITASRLSQTWANIAVLIGIGPTVTDINRSTL